MQDINTNYIPILKNTNCSNVLDQIDKIDQVTLQNTEVFENILKLLQIDTKDCCSISVDTDSTIGIASVLFFSDENNTNVSKHKIYFFHNMKVIHIIEFSPKNIIHLSPTLSNIKINYEKYSSVNNTNWCVNNTLIKINSFERKTITGFKSLFATKKQKMLYVIAISNNDTTDFFNIVIENNGSFYSVFI